MPDGWCSDYLSEHHVKSPGEPKRGYSPVGRSRSPREGILFGSKARVEVSKESDLEPLMTLPAVPDWCQETARLRLPPQDIPMVLVVVEDSRADVKEREHRRGTMLYHVLREGRILHKAIGPCSRTPCIGEGGWAGSICLGSAAYIRHQSGMVDVTSGRASTISH